MTAVAARRRSPAIATVSGFSWARRRAHGVGDGAGVDARPGASCATAGLDALAELPLDAIADPTRRSATLARAGFQPAAADDRQGAGRRARCDLLLRAADAAGRVRLHRRRSIRCRLSLSAFRPTTGYDDVKMVALARLAAPNIPSIQVDWPRYGPKLAQVALTFGADDLDGVSAVGRRAGRPPARAARRDPPQHRGGRLRAGRARRPLRRDSCVMPAVRIGAVGYLNARPLTWALDRDAGALAGALRPAVGLRGAAAGGRGRSRADSVDRVPAVAPTTASCPGVGIGSRGPVASVALFTRRPVERDPAHRARHQLAHVGGADPGAVPAPLPHRAGVRAARPGPRRR